MKFGSVSRLKEHREPAFLQIPMKGLTMRSTLYKFIIMLLMSPAISAFAANLDGAGAPNSGGKVGVGIAFFGVPGLSVYADVTQRNFLQAAIGFSRSGSYAVTADYAFAYYNAISSLPSITPYWGVGGLLLHDQSDYWSDYARDSSGVSEYFGARIPLGLNWVIPNTPVQLAFEVAPSILMSPSSYGFLQGGFSARILF